MIGTTVGHYRILAPIGEGGMGTVYRGEDTMLQRQVAIKVLRPELSKEKALVERFRTEAVALARLNHPNIAAVYGLIQERSQYYMVLEYVDGETLEAIVARRGALPWLQAVQIAKDTLGALDHAHRMGVVHRDLKPSNLMLTRGGELKVMDFGIARMAGTSRHTEYGRIVGTPLYMSPEQLRGEEVDGRSDVYSLGVVLYELLTGREAFQADSDYALLMAQLNQMPVPASRFVASLPTELEATLTRSFEKDKANRWTSASAFRRALNAIVPEPATEDVPFEPKNAGPTRVSDQAQSSAPTRIASDQSVAPTRIAETGRNQPAKRGAGLAAFFQSRVGIGVGMVAVTAMALAAILKRGPTAGPGPTAPPANQPLGPATPPPPVMPAAAPAPPAPRPAVPIAANFGAVVEEPRPRPAGPPSAGYGEIVEPGAKANRPRGSQPNPSRPPSSAAPEPGPLPTAPKAPAPPPASANSAGEPTAGAATPVAFGTGITEIAGWLKAKDVVAVKRTFAGDEATETGLVKLLEEFPVALEKETLVGPAETQGNRATAEYSATLRWRSSFGNTRKVPVRIVLTLGHDSGTWRLTSWRFATNPELK